jgi:hypothetical protein
VNILEKPIRKVAFALGSKFLVTLVKDAAEGKHGPKWKSFYWALAGLKRPVAIILGLIAAVCAALGMLDVAAYVGIAGALLYSVGLLDAGWRNVKPLDSPPDNAVYRFLAGNAGTITTLLATAAAFVDAGHCGHYDCQLLMQVLVGTGAGLAYLGCADAAWRARPPFVLPGRTPRG